MCGAGNFYGFSWLFNSQKQIPTSTLAVRRKEFRGCTLIYGSWCTEDGDGLGSPDPRLHKSKLWHGHLLTILAAYQIQYARTSRSRKSPLGFPAPFRISQENEPDGEAAQIWRREKGLIPYSPPPPPASNMDGARTDGRKNATSFVRRQAEAWLGKEMWIWRICTNIRGISLELAALFRCPITSTTLRA